MSFDRLNTRLYPQITSGSLKVRARLSFLSNPANLKFVSKVSGNPEFGNNSERQSRIFGNKSERQSRRKEVGVR
jgi:hypothetical protein